MSQPIISIKEREAGSQRTVANLLPCRIHHNGPVDPIDSFWNSSSTAEHERESRVAYFRGRKLQGKTVKLPQQCRGVVLRRDDSAQKTKPQHTEAIEDFGEMGPETGVMQVQAEFDEMVVWGHEAAVNAQDDPYIRGINEWLHVSERIHSYTEDGSSTTAN